MTAPAPSEARKPEEAPSGLPERLKPFQWKKGVSPNPGGKPKGTLNSLSGDFVAAMTKDFRQNGQAAIEACRKESPAKYLAIIASMMPKELGVNVKIGTAFEDISDAHLAAALLMLGDEEAARQLSDIIEGEAVEA